MELIFILPLISGFLYAFSSFLTKRALMEGAGILRFAFLSNAAMLVTFSLPLIWSDRTVDWTQWHWPVLTGVFFFCGQVFTFAAIRVGDVSIQTPLMGTKVLFVAVLAVFFGVQEVSTDLWIAAAITTLAIGMLGFSGGIAKGNVGVTVGLALGSAAMFALADVTLGHGARRFGPAGFLSVMMVTNFLCSVTLLPFFRGGFRAITAAAWPWVIGGALGMAIQSSILGFFFANTGLIAEGNILYSSRGIWSVVMGICLAGVFMLPNERMSRPILIQRLLGALLMSAAIWLVLR